MAELLGAAGFEMKRICSMPASLQAGAMVCRLRAAVFAIRVRSSVFERLFKDLHREKGTRL
ncbi:hypothetical protein ATN89_03370 [Comamonas thiooxydans]|nr:hypothetical protein ATN89_03370 [Comamonas thiooxydans]